MRSEDFNLGIKARSQDTKLNSILYGNRAAAQKHLGNLASAARDCLFAAKFALQKMRGREIDSLRQQSINEYLRA